MDDVSGEPGSSRQLAPEDELAQLWDAVRGRLRDSVPESTFRIWLEPLKAAGREGTTLYLDAPDGIRVWVERRYTGLINEALAQVAASLREVSFSPNGGGEPARGAGEAPAPLNTSYTFERFVIGEGNRIAHGAALTVAEAPGEAYNPLFLHGPPGLGKTHLLVAIANYLQEGAPALSVRYTTAESFTNEFVTALQTQGTEQFKLRYRDLDVLLVDDVQFLQGKHHTEEEFFHTFNALYEAGSQLVLSADRIPSELSTLAARLRDRFEWGLTVAVERPNLATRLTVLRRLVRESGIDVRDGDALSELAGRIDANIRQLHGALTRVLAHASLLARPLTRELISEVLPDYKPTPRAEATPELIRTKVGEALGVAESSIVGKSRATRDVRARQLAIFLTRELTDLSLPQIGREFGRDHSTVISSIRRVTKQAASDPSTAATLERLRTALHSITTGHS